MLGAALRTQRRQREETLGETAARAGISPQYLSEIERGVKDPSSEMIAAVAGALGLSLGELMRGIGDTLESLETVSMPARLPARLPDQASNRIPSLSTAANPPAPAAFLLAA
ncbi:helix-turn-helix domain protein [Leucobacter sp. 7(1)]|nr:helix-turn-helix domain protein [Leucobacter sp. 7(1)]